MSLNDETIDRIAQAVAEKSRSATGCEGCRYNEKEAEWVHTGAKYIPSKDIPTLGNFARLLSKTEQEVGMWVIRAVLLIGGGGAIVAGLVKLGVLRVGGGK